VISCSCRFYLLEIGKQTTNNLLDNTLKDSWTKSMITRLETTDNNSLAAESPHSLDNKRLGSFPEEVARVWCLPGSTFQGFEAPEKEVVSNNIIRIACTDQQTKDVSF
jgi:hypothetical protein